ncbi:hypothetical protein ACFL20_11385 [Spirochaetota bacterium]
MKQIEDKSLESARNKFMISIVMVIIAIIYLISPVDFIPGPPPFEWIEDIPILLGTLIYSGYTYNKLKKQRDNSKTEGTDEK